MTALPLQVSGGTGVPPVPLRLGVAERTEDGRGFKPDHPASLRALRASAVNDPWLPISTAAPVLGMTADALRVRCHREFAPRALARVMPNEAGRREWFVHASIDPRLLRLHSPAALARAAGEVESLHRATAAQREKARLKARVVVMFRAWRSGTGFQPVSPGGMGVPPVRNIRAQFALFAARVKSDLGLGVSLGRVYAWSQACAGSSSEAEIAASLLDRRGGARGKGIHHRGAENTEKDGKTGEWTQGGQDSGLSPDAWSLFERLYLDPRQLSMSACWRAVRDLAPSNGWRWVSEGTVRRLAARRLPPRVRDLARLGSEAWSKAHRTPVEQDPDAWAPGECWEADHSIFDCFIRDFRGGKWIAVRPWLTAWLDRRSRCLMGWRVSFEHNATTIRLSLLSALRANGYGVPLHAWLDNGKDFQSRQLHGLPRAARKGVHREDAGGIAPDDPLRDLRASAVNTHSPAERAAQIGLFSMLGIETHFAVPYNHNGKARIERFFGVMHQDFDRAFHSWCGSKPGDRDKKSLDEAVADVMSLPTLEEFAERFAAWAAVYNTTTDHAIEDLDGLSRLEFYARFLPARRVAKDASLAELEREVEQPRVATKRGVRLKVGARTYFYGGGHPMLADLVGSKRRVWLTYDPQDLASVRVWDEEGRLLCVADRNTRHGGVLSGGTPVSRAGLKEAQALQRRQEREARRPMVIDDALLTDVERASLLERSRRAEREAARIRGASDAPLQLVGTPIDGGAGAGPVASAAVRELIEAPVVPLSEIVALLGREASRVPAPEDAPLSPSDVARLMREEERA